MELTNDYLTKSIAAYSQFKLEVLGEYAESYRELCLSAIQSATLRLELGDALTRLDTVHRRSQGIRPQLAPELDLCAYDGALSMLYLAYGRYDEASVELGNEVAILESIIKQTQGPETLVWAESLNPKLAMVGGASADPIIDAASFRSGLGGQAPESAEHLRTCADLFRIPEWNPAAFAECVLGKPRQPNRSSTDWEICVQIWHLLTTCFTVVAESIAFLGKDQLCERERTLLIGFLASALPASAGFSSLVVSTDVLRSCLGADPGPRNVHPAISLTIADLVAACEQYRSGIWTLVESILSNVSAAALNSTYSAVASASVLSLGEWSSNVQK